MTSFESELAALIAVWGRRLTTAEIIKALEDAITTTEQEA